MKNRMIMGAILCLVLMLSVVIYELRTHDTAINRLIKHDVPQPQPEMG